MHKRTRNSPKTVNSGRPRKFAEPSRPITLTLPESTLHNLRQIDPDRGRAIVKLTKNALPNDGSEKPLVEISKISDGTGLVVIGPSEVLRQIPFLHLVEVAPGRYLLALTSGHDFKHLEIALNDILEDLPPSERRERGLITQLLQHIKRLRRSELASTAVILFVGSAQTGRKRS